jgi:hypothetical protein
VAQEFFEHFFILIHIILSILYLHSQVQKFSQVKGMDEEGRKEIIIVFVL